MNNDDDRLLEVLARLSPVAPDPEWEALVRERCRNVMSKPRAPARRLVDLAAAIALAAYLAAALIEAARLAVALS
jgi:hypothetical protein